MAGAGKKLMGLLAAAAAVVVTASVVPAVPAHASGGWLGWWEQAQTGPARPSSDINLFWLRVCGAGQVCAVDILDADSDSTWGDTLPTLTTPALQQRMEAAKATGARVWLTVTDEGQSEAVKATLNSSSASKRAATSIVKAAKGARAWGVDIDIETPAFAMPSSTWPQLQAPWRRFITYLANTAHEAGLKVAVTVPVGVRAGVDGGYGSYEWKHLGKVVDRVNLMSYEYSVAGPGAPIWWVRKAVSDARAQIPARKIRVGINAVGSSVVTDTSMCKPGWKPATARTRPTWSQTQAIVAREAKLGRFPQWNRSSAEWELRYTLPIVGVDGTTCAAGRTMHYLGVEGVKARVREGTRVGGVMVWGLGGLDKQALNAIGW